MSRESIHYQILERAVEIVKALKIQEFGQHVYLLPSSQDAKQAIAGLPAVVISPFGAETTTEATNAQDDYRYPVHVAIMDESGSACGDGLKKRLLWRELLIEAFSEPMEVQGVDVGDQFLELRDIVNPAAWSLYKRFLSTFVVRVEARLLRGDFDGS